jgi:hypothetical protein
MLRRRRAAGGEAETYRCGVLGSDPCIICDGCHFALYIRTGASVPPKWFLDNKPPRGWAKGYEGEKRWDKCPECKVKP